MIIRVVEADVRTLIHSKAPGTLDIDNAKIYDLLCAAPCPTRSLNGPRIFAFAPGSPKVCSKKVRALEADRK